MSIPSLPAWPWRERLSPVMQRYRRLTRREQVMLVALTAFLLVTVLYLAVWLPALRYRDEGRAYFQQQRELQAYLRARAPEVASARPPEQVAPERLQGVVASSAARHELELEQLNAEAGGGVQVSLRPAEAARLLPWLERLQALGVAVEEAGLERQADNRVSARLILRVAP